MRILLLPVSTRQSVLYCPRLNPAALSASSAAATTTTTTTSSTSAASAAAATATPAPSYIDRITAKANSTWLEWEKKESGWQKRVATYGNQLLKRLPYQEYGLKSIPPLNRAAKEKWDEKMKELAGPQAQSMNAPDRQKSAEATLGKDLRSQTPVSVEFPAAMMEDNQVWHELKRLGSEETQGFHRRRLLWCLVGMPVSAPFALIPIIPNLPFFYLCYRAWSHWRARSGSKHLQFLLEKQLLRLQPSTQLQMAYMDAALNHRMKKIDADVKALRSPSDAATKVAEEEVELESFGGDERMLLSSSSGQTIAEWSNVPEVHADIDRAVWQVQKSIRAKRELAEEKSELDSVNQKAEQQR